MRSRAIQPAVGAEHYKTYQVLQPAKTHLRAATCAEADCPNYAKGWRVRVEGLPEDMLHTAKTSGRKYAVLAIAEGETWLVFEAGQSCFAVSEHRVPVGRPEIYRVTGGDFRGNPRQIQPVTLSPDNWVDDFANHQQRVADAVQRG